MSVEENVPSNPVEEKKQDSMDVDAAPEIEDLTGDGGVMKEVLKEGEGWEKPSQGAEVWVHYTGTLTDGSKFDSSRDRDQEFKFNLGAGDVIKGWDETVKTMKKGEICKVTLKPEYAYGAAGSPPKIPPNATLVFEIELLRFRSDKDITYDGGVLKRVVREASEKYGPSPNYESEVKVRFLGKLADGTVVDDETREFTIGDIELPKGVEKAIESLKVGEVATFVIRPDYAYGAAGNAQKNIPANATLHYEMELLHLNKQKDYWDFDKFSDKLDACLLRKNQGNDYFKAKKYNQALRKYKRGLEFVESTYNASEEEKKKVTEMKVLLNLNLAQCNLNLREWKTAIENCNKALEHDKANPKAFFRRGVARSALDEWSLASADFDKALELSPGDAAVISEYNKLKHKMKQQDLKDKRLYSNIFKKLSEQNDQPAAAASTATATTTTAAGASDDKMDVDSGSQ